MGHAEENIIAYSARMGIPLDGCTLLMRWFPCYICTRLIIGAGIRKVICDKINFADETRYNFKEAKQMFDEAGVEIEYIADILKE